jgi:hypothetical protein
LPRKRTLTHNHHVHHVQEDKYFVRITMVISPQ